MLSKLKSIPPQISKIINNVKARYVILCSIPYKEERQKLKIKAKSHNSQRERILILKVGSDKILKIGKYNIKQKLNKDDF